MRLGLPSLALFVLPLACSFDSSGQPEVGSGGEDEVDVTTGTTNESGGESGSDQGTSSSADTSTSESTTESTTDPTTDESTSDPTTESTTETTTDPTTDESTDTTTDESTDTTTDTGIEGDPYGMCDACLPSEGCIDELAFNPGWEVCYTPCGGNDDCPAAAGGEPVACILYDFANRCFIDCSSESCPMGMSCKTVNFGLNKVCAFDI